MRVHRLQLAGIGPFSAAQDLDFDALSQGGLFLLTGPTGAGKTTILDAIVYALYGSVPGARGRGSRGERGTSARIVSDLRSLDSQPKVEVEFSVQGRRLRVARTPQHERPRSRGDGTTTDKGSVHLWELRDGDWQPLSDRVDEVQTEILTMLGMNAEQFAQVVLLPQGEFAGFLRANDQQRREILSRLFRVDRYATAERWLEDRAKESRQALETATREAAAIVQRAAGALHLPEGEAQLATPGVEAARDWLAPHQLAITHASAEAATALEQATTAAEAAAQRLAATRAAHERAEAHELRAARLAELEERLDAARRWLAEQGEESLSSSPEGWPQAAAQAAERRAQLEERQGDAERAAALTARAEQASAQLTALQQAQAELAERLPRLAEAVAHAQQGAHAAAAAPAELAAAQEAAQQLEQAMSAATHLSALTGQHESAAQAVDAASAADQSARRRLSEDAAEAQALLTMAREHRVAAREALQEVQAARLQARASELAASLVDGQPCAVCGAVHHPSPATPVDGRDLAAEQERCAAHVARTEHAVEQIADAATTLAQARAELDPDAPALTAVPSATLPSEPAERQARLTQLLAAVQAARQARRALEEARGQLTDLAGRMDEARRQVEAQPVDPEMQAAAQARLARATEAAADAARAQERLAQATTELQAAEAERERLATELARCSQQIASDREQASTLTAHLVQLSAPYPSLAEAIEAARTRSAGLDHATECLRERENVVAELAAAATALDAAQIAEQTSADEPTERAERLAARTRAADAARQAAAEQFSARERLAAQHRALADAGEQLDALSTRLGPLMTEAERLQRLDQTVRGQGDNHRRISLTTYVLAARLEEVAAAATQHLLRMSSGRYELRHHDDRYGNAQAGLGLRVLDGHSGEARDTATLSGGEAFYASLALALGLADVVQREAGGRPLEMLLVDEGFGSLDAATLDDVLGELDELRSRGRAIGVVSHVGALSERITAQLQVQPGPTGSTARVRVGAEPEATS